MAGHLGQVRVSVGCQPVCCNSGPISARCGSTALAAAQPPSGADVQRRTALAAQDRFHGGGAKESALGHTHDSHLSTERLVQVCTESGLLSSEPDETVDDDDLG
jgi:hypothetical protein